MKEFFNKYFSKELLERYGLTGTLIGGLSILSGVIYQYHSLSYTELSFFSWTQAINDGVKILPTTISIFLFGFIGYEIVLKVFESTDKIKYKETGNITIIFFISVILGIILYFSRESFSSNILGTIYIGLVSLILILILIIFFYIIHFNYLEKDKEITSLKWLSKNNGFIVLIIIFFTLLNSFGFMVRTHKSIDKHNCFIHQGKIFQLKYMNDKYIFTDIYIGETNTGEIYQPRYTLIFENKAMDFVLLFQSCKEIDKNNTRYIKKDDQCIEVLSYNNTYQYLETKEGLIKNNGYDLYLTGYCIPDLIRDK